MKKSMARPADEYLYSKCINNETEKHLASYAKK